GKRYSGVKLVNKDTVKCLSLKWITPLVQGCGPTGRDAAGAGVAALFGGGGGRGGGLGSGAGYPIIAGGFGNGDANTCGPARLNGGILMGDGRLYAASPHNVFAIDRPHRAVPRHNYWKAP